MPHGSAEARLRRVLGNLLPVRTRNTSQGRVFRRARRLSALHFPGFICNGGSAVGLDPALRLSEFK
jgi:hypothetical protein